ncbi:MAG TPA: zinc ribbon domain-containing protein [Symbiobacteriaceae bacterium]|nr:zinc ribbon domain-containing protein [Symbiobacteriaceae bacterium]
MSVQCQNCGSVQPGGKFCPSCGGQMLPVAPNQAPPPPPVQQQFLAAAQMPTYPQQMPMPPKAGGGKGWVLWAAIGGGVLAIGAAAAFFLLRDKPAPTPPPEPPKTVQVNPAPTPTPTAPPETKPTTPPAKTVGTTSLRLLSQGTFGARPRELVAMGSYLGYGTDDVAALYKVDAKGQPKELSRIQVTGDVGKLMSLAIGTPYNDGKPYLFALFETKLYIIPDQGPAKAVDSDGSAERVMIGDWDGDGKTETIYMGYDAKGDYGFDVWRYPADSYLYRKEGRQDPWPALFPTEMKAGQTSLLMGYSVEGDALSLLLYKWDGVGGPAVIGKYPVENKVNAVPEWLAAGPSGFGPTMAVSRNGAKPSIEVLTIAADAKSAKLVGRFESEGTGRSAVIPGNFTGQGSQLLTIDEAGKYFMYDIGK